MSNCMSGHYCLNIASPSWQTAAESLLSPQDPTICSLCALLTTLQYHWLQKVKPHTVLHIITSNIMATLFHYQCMKGTSTLRYRLQDFKIFAVSISLACRLSSYTKLTWHMQLEV